MSDLREALDDWDAMTMHSSFGALDADSQIISAARRFLALTETGRRQWCVLHGAPVWNVASGECIGAHHITPVAPCEIVPAHIVLADYLTEEE